jgi:hypothetical protein
MMEGFFLSRSSDDLLGNHRQVDKHQYTTIFEKHKSKPPAAVTTHTQSKELTHQKNKVKQPQPKGKIVNNTYKTSTRSTQLERYPPARLLKD